MREIAVVNAQGQYATTRDGLDIALFSTRYAAMKYAAKLPPEEGPYRSKLVDSGTTKA